MFVPKPVPSMEDYKLEQLDINLLSVCKGDLIFGPQSSKFQRESLLTTRTPLVEIYGTSLKARGSAEGAIVVPHVWVFLCTGGLSEGRTTQGAVPWNITAHSSSHIPCMYCV